MKISHKKSKQTIFSTFFMLLCVAFLAAACAQDPTSRGDQAQALTTIPVLNLLQGLPGLPHVHLFRPYTQVKANGSGTLMTYHGGPVMRTTSTSYVIFWEPRTLGDGFPTHVSKTYNTLLERYFHDIGGSGLYQNNTQYYDKTGNIVNSSTFGGAWLDRSTYPFPTCFDLITPHGCISDAQIQNEVTKAMRVNHWTGGLNHLFFVYTSWGEGSCYDASSCAFSDYCAYHSSYTLGKQAVLYANMPYTATLPEGCMTKKSPNNDSDADSTISVTSHEQIEAVTDPLINAWYDSNQYEIGDKCAWNFGSVSLNGGTANVEWNGHYYLVQQEWSNARKGCTLQG